MPEDNHFVAHPDGGMTTESAAADAAKAPEETSAEAATSTTEQAEASTDTSTSNDAEKTEDAADGGLVRRVPDESASKTEDDSEEKEEE